MRARQEIMTFRYRALFQSLDVKFFKTQKEKSFLIECEADIKLPVLKKSYVVATEFSNSSQDWIRHAPVREKGAQEKWVEKDSNNSSAIDPVGFFMMFEENAWTGTQVSLLIGAKVVDLAVYKVDNGFEISRPEKNQKLRVITSPQGIKKIEVPLPVIGAVGVERV